MTLITGSHHYEYLAHLLKVVDGDTVHLAVDCGLDIFIKLKCRLYGINAPEMRTKAGPLAKTHLSELLVPPGSTNTTVYVRTLKDKTEKYGRYLVKLYVSSAMEESVNDQMVADGHAVAYMVS